MSKQATALSLASSTDQPRVTPTVSHDTLIAASAQIVSAYIAGRAHEAFNLTELTANVYGTLSALARGETAPVTVAARKPQVPVEDSIHGDYLICLEDGKQVKMLKRYLKSNFNMTPEEYRARWELPASYPMVAPNYAKVRSQLAKQIGLGRNGPARLPRRFGDDKAGLA